MHLHGLAAARERGAALDAAIAELVGRLPSDVGPVAAVALGAYGRAELTPRAEVDVLFLHAGQLSLGLVTEVICYRLWAEHAHLEPRLSTLAECAAGARRSLSLATDLLDARLVGGDATLFEALVRQTIGPLRRDREQLRQRLRPFVECRQATHPAVTSASAPDVVAGRGGLLDAATLRWLTSEDDARLDEACDLLLGVLAELEEQPGQAPHRLTRHLQPRVAAALGCPAPGELMATLHGQARWVAFRLASALAPRRPDRRLGTHFSLRHGWLAGEQLPPIETLPSLGLRAAALAGYAPPDPRLLAWASAPGQPLGWDEATAEHLWLLLRAADWRAFEFLDVTGLLVRYLPAMASIWRRDGADQTLDTHAFLALRRLHAWTDADDPFVRRVWRTFRHRDWLYLAVLLHELGPEQATAAAERIGVPHEMADSIGFTAAEHGLLLQVATQRDLHDEDLLLNLAGRIGSPQRLRLLFLVAVAHQLALGDGTWDGWQAGLVRQLFGRLDGLLRHGGELGPRRRRSVEHHRQRIRAELRRQGLVELEPVVERLPQRYVLARSAAFVVRHLRLLGGGPLRDGEVRLRAHHHRADGTWDLLIVARDRPGLLATFAGVLALRGASVLAADAATCSDGLVLDVFSVTSAYGLPLERRLWDAVEADLRAALEDRLPLEELLGARPAQTGEQLPAVSVRVDNAASQFFSLVEVRAPDGVGLLYRIASALRALGLDIHHAKIATHAEGALDVFYVWDLGGAKLDEAAAAHLSRELCQRLGGPPGA